MLRSLIHTVRRTNILCKNNSRLFSSDWAKDREKAAEKEFAIKEENEKKKKIRAKVSEEKLEPKLKDAMDHHDNIEEILADREYLLVILQEKAD